MIEGRTESDDPPGHVATMTEVESPGESGPPTGLPSSWPYVDAATASLARHARAWDRMQRFRIAMGLAGLLDEPMMVEVQSIERRIGARAQRALKAHPLGDWLPAGVRGNYVCLIIALIRDPRRFPGQVCANGHHVPSGVWPEGAPCPVRERDAEGPPESDTVIGEPSTDAADVAEVDTFLGVPCGAPLSALRRGTGVRSLWHYFGLAPGMRKRKGAQATFHPRGKSLVLAPDAGVSAQIVRLNVEPWVSIYREQKARLTREHGAEEVNASEGTGGAGHATESGTASGAVRLLESVVVGGADVPLASDPLYGATDGAAVGTESESEISTGLRPIQVDRTARKIAAKAFLGDLLTEWKRRVEGSS